MGDGQGVGGRGGAGGGGECGGLVTAFFFDTLPPHLDGPELEVYDGGSTQSAISGI